MIETEAWLLPRDQHDSEASFVSHHPSVSFGSLCQRNGFEHRMDLLRGAKGKRVLGIYRRSGHRSRNRTHTEKERDRIDANRFICSGSGDNKLAARSKSSEQRRHGFAICRCREDQSGTAQDLKRRNRLLNLGVNVMMCPEFLRETFLFRSARNGRDSKTHASRKLDSEVAKPANALNSDELAGSSLRISQPVECRQ